MGKNLDETEAYREEAISQGAMGYCLTTQMLQVPATVENKYYCKSTMVCKMTMVQSKYFLSRKS